MSAVKHQGHTFRLIFESEIEIESCGADHGNLQQSTEYSAPCSELKMPIVSLANFDCKASLFFKHTAISLC